MSNNTPFDSVLREGRVTSLAVPFWTKPGFAIPLIQSSADSNTTYVQRVNGDRKIIGFDMFQGGSRIVPLESTHEARVGAREVFALVDPDGDPYAGTRNELAPIVKNWVRSVDPPLLRMSFALFCGDEALAEQSAAEAVKSKTSEFRDQEQAVLWFINAVIVAEVFSALTEAHGPQRERTKDRVFDNALASVRFSKERLVMGCQRRFSKVRRF